MTAVLESYQSHSCSRLQQILSHRSTYSLRQCQYTLHFGGIRQHPPNTRQYLRGIRITITCMFCIICMSIWWCYSDSIQLAVITNFFSNLLTALERIYIIVTLIFAYAYYSTIEAKSRPAHTVLYYHNYIPVEPCSETNLP